MCTRCPSVPKATFVCAGQALCGDCDAAASFAENPHSRRAVRARIADVAVAVRQRYCNLASTSAEPEIPSSAAWTMRKMKTAAAAANAIRNRGK
jgi:hypothetical protein